MEDHGLKGYGPFQWRPKADDMCGLYYRYYYQWMRRKDNGKPVAKFIVAVPNTAVTESEIKEEIRQAFERTDWPWAEYPEVMYPDESSNPGYYLSPFLSGPFYSAEDAESGKSIS